MNKGLLGILAAGAVLSRVRVRDEELLQYIAEMNSIRVIDAGWEDYVNLSITALNGTFFEICSKKWHPTTEWAVLAFDPEILEHNGVVFCTTNNAYPRCSRGKGVGGLEALFAPRVNGRFQDIHERAHGLPDYLTTDEQAEVLYPQSLSTDYLRRVYVRTGEFADQVHAHFGAVGHRDVEIIVAPEQFKPRGVRVL